MLAAAIAGATTLLLLQDVAAQSAIGTADSSAANPVPLVRSETVMAAIEPALAEITSEQTDELIAEDVQDFTVLLPGVQAMDLGTIGQPSPLIFHGGSPTQSGLLLDGVPVEDPIFGFANPMNLPINILESLAVIGTGGFAPFGYQASHGTLQAQTVEMQPNHPYSKVQFRAGDWSYSDLGILFIVPLSPKLQLTVAGNRQEFDGFVVTGQKHTGSRIHGKLAYQPSAAVTLAYQFHKNKNDADVPAPLSPDFVPLVADANRVESRFDHVFSIAMGDLATGHKELRSNVTISKVRHESSGENISFNNRSLALAAALQERIRTGRHLLSFGGRLRSTDVAGEQLGDHSDSFGYVFARDEVTLTRHVRLGLQVRAEKHDDYAAALTPGVQLIYRLSDHSRWFLGWQRSRRYPSFLERFWPGFSFHGNPDLQEEAGVSGDVGYAFKSGVNELYVSAFWNRTNDWVTTQQAPSTLKGVGLLNQGDRTAVGFDARVTWHYATGGRMGLTGSFIEIAEDDASKQPRIPEWSLYTFMEYGHPFFEKYVFIRVRLDGRFWGRRYGTRYVGQLPLGELVRLDTDFVLDGKISFIFKDAKLVISQENMLNRTYQLVPGFFMPVRTLRFGVEWEFWD